MAGDVAVIRMSALGDVALAIAAVYDAALSNPDTHFTFITKKGFTALCVNAPANVEVLGADTRGVHKGVGGILRLARNIRADRVVDLHDVLRSRLLDFRLAVRGCRVQVFDKARQPKRILTRIGAHSAPAVSSTVTRYREALERAGVPCRGLFCGLYAQKPADAGLYASLTARKAVGQTWIGIAPFAAHQGKIWPPERMHNVVRTLQGRAHTQVFLFGGGPEETAMLDQWAVETGALSVAAARLGFAGELALMSALDLMVSMDSGNMHMAALAGTSTVSIWGQTHPAAGFAPWPDAPGVIHVMVQDPTRHCRPCSIFGNRRCHISAVPPCMGAITEQQVLAAIYNTLSQSSQLSHNSHPTNE